MTFAVRQQLVRQLYEGWGLEGWGAMNIPPNAGQLQDQIHNICFDLQELTINMNNNREYQRWRTAVQQMSENPNRLNELEFMRWLIRGYSYHLNNQATIIALFTDLQNAVAQLGGYLAVPQEEQQRLDTFNNILHSTQMITQLLTPLRQFANLRQNYPAHFNTAQNWEGSWAYHDDPDLYSVFTSFHDSQQRLRQFFNEESLQGWGAQAQIPPNELDQRLNLLDDMRMTVELMRNTLYSDHQFLQFRALVENYASNPNAFRNQSENIIQGYWLYHDHYEELRSHWDDFLVRLENLGPYLSNPEDNPERRQAIALALFTAELLEELLRTFVTVRTNLPQVVNKQRGHGPGGPGGPTGGFPSLA